MGPQHGAIANQLHPGTRHFERDGAPGGVIQGALLANVLEQMSDNSNLQLRISISADHGGRRLHAGIVLGGLDDGMDGPFGALVQQPEQLHAQTMREIVSPGAQHRHHPSARRVTPAADAAPDNLVGLSIGLPVGLNQERTPAA